MGTIRKSITLTDVQDQWIKKQIEEGHFTNDSEYIRDLVRRDKARHDNLFRLKTAIDEGLDSGVSEKKGVDIMKEIEGKLKADGSL